MKTASRTPDLATVSESEAALLLGLTPAGVAAMYHRGCLEAQCLGRRRYYDLEDIKALKTARALNPERRGRPSARQTLERRFNFGVWATSWRAPRERGELAGTPKQRAEPVNRNECVLCKASQRSR